MNIQEVKEYRNEKALAAVSVSSVWHIGSVEVEVEEQKLEKRSRSKSWRSR